MARETKEDILGFTLCGVLVLTLVLANLTVACL